MDPQTQSTTGPELSMAPQGDMIPLVPNQETVPAMPEQSTQPSAAMPVLPPLPPAAPQVPDNSTPTVPVPPVPVEPTSIHPTAPAVADDLDLIEKEWVDKAKEIVAKTRTDPHAQNKEINLFKADYMKKRYSKDIKIET